MQDIINTKHILNRKIVIEIRYGTLADILDNRGKIAQKLLQADIIKNANWGYATAGIEIYDDAKIKSQLISVNINVIRFIDECFYTNEEYWNKFTKVYKTLVPLLNKPTQKYTRIGCRIQGSYNKDNTKFNDILKSIMSKFPNQLLIEDFKYNDTRFVLVYDNGRYEVGPVKDNDLWLEQVFQKTSKFNSKEGLGIDTDNYSINVGSLDEASLVQIKQVFDASLAVESSLFEKLS